MNPMHSRLLFTQIDEIDGEDGDLHSWELYNMHLNARLAVLSACNTGFGKLNRGEGVMSLGRAFAYAGCPSVILSLWPAQDAVTADIMSDFYTNLVNSVPIDQSLRKAKLNYLENSNDIFSHPFYWAGFVAQGDTSPLWIEKNAIGWRWLVVFFPVFLFPIIYYFLLKNEKTTKV